MGTLVDWQIQHLCGDRSYKPRLNLKTMAYKWFVPSPKKPLITPYNPEQVNAASYDVCVGDKVKLLSCENLRYKVVRRACRYEGGTCGLNNVLVPDYGSQEWEDVNLIELASQGKKLYFTQGDLLLTETDCFFNIPRNISAQFALKSSRGREGYEHLSAGFIDPAWHGSKLTMELFNANPNPIPIYKGLKIGQIIFTKCDSDPIRAYDVRGRYNNDDGVRESKG